MDTQFVPQLNTFIEKVSLICYIPNSLLSVGDKQSAFNWGTKGVHVFWKHLYRTIPSWNFHAKVDDEDEDEDKDEDEDDKDEDDKIMCGETHYFAVSDYGALT